MWLSIIYLLVLVLSWVDSKHFVCLFVLQVLGHWICTYPTNLSIDILFSKVVIPIYLFICFSGLHPQHMEVPRLGVKSELQLPAYTPATAMWDTSCTCNLHYSSWQHRILNPPSEVRHQTRILMDTSQVCYCWATMGIPGVVSNSHDADVGNLS